MSVAVAGAMMRRTTMALRQACAGRSKPSISIILPSRLANCSTKHVSLRGGLRFPIRAIQYESVPEATKATATRVKGDDVKSEPDWKIKMLYDGDCPLCMSEVNMLKERNKEYGAIKFVDISSDDYSPHDNQGLEYETAMGKIHAIMSDGTIVTNVEAFRKLYEAVGLGWVYAITKYEPVATIADAVYNVWAKYRLPITGRPPLEQVLEARKKKKEAVCNDNNSCKIFDTWSLTVLKCQQFLVYKATIDVTSPFIWKIGIYGVSVEIYPV